MTLQLKVLTPATQIAATAMAIYAAPANTTAIVKAAVFTNINAGSQSFSIYRVTAGGSPTASNVLIYSYTLATKASYVAIELANMVLAAGDTLYANSSLAGSINAFLSGFEVS